MPRLDMVGLLSDSAVEQEVHFGLVQRRCIVHIIVHLPTSSRQSSSFIHQLANHDQFMNRLVHHRNHYSIARINQFINHADDLTYTYSSLSTLVHEKPSRLQALKPLLEPDSAETQKLLLSIF